jgi:hypothetical protein
MVEDPSVEGGDGKLYKVWELVYMIMDALIWCTWICVLIFCVLKGSETCENGNSEKSQVHQFFAYAHVFKIFVAVMISEYLYLVQVSYE